MAVFEQETAGAIINQSALECGLATSTDPVADPGAIMTQLTALLKAEGRRMRKVHEWMMLDATYSFSTSGGTPYYTLPVDFGRVIDQTMWNRTNRLPQGGPLGPSEWQYLKSRLVGVVFTTLFRIIQNNWRVYPDTPNTPNNYVLAYEYVSRFWAIPNGLALPASYSEWNNNTLYANGAVIRSGGLLYKATQAGTGNTAIVGPYPAGLTQGQPAWAQNTAFVSGQFVTNGANTYVCVQSGTSANPGAGPSGTGLGIADGSCKWDFQAVTASLPATITDNTCTWQLVSRAGDDQLFSSNDIVLFEADLMVKSLNLAYKRAHRFASQDDIDAYEQALQLAKDNDMPADILRLDKASGDVPLIGERNIPLTGFGGP